MGLESVDQRTESFEVFAVESGDCINTGDLGTGGDVCIGEVPVRCASKLQGTLHQVRVGDSEALEGKDPGEDIKNLCARKPVGSLEGTGDLEQYGRARHQLEIPLRSSAEKAGGLSCKFSPPFPHLKP